jgi:hypothetical protein
MMSTKDLHIPRIMTVCFSVTTACSVLGCITHLLCGMLECLACVIPYHHISAHLHCHHAYHITINMKIEEELHRQDQGEQPQVARIKQKRSKNTDHVIALQKGQARYQSSQKTKLQESNECDQEYESAPYNTQETHNNLNMKIEFLNHTGISSGTLSVLEGLVYVIELHVYFSMWSEAEGLSEYGVVPE